MMGRVAGRGGMMGKVAGSDDEERGVGEEMAEGGDDGEATSTLFKIIILCPEEQKNSINMHTRALVLLRCWFLLFRLLLAVCPNRSSRGADDRFLHRFL
jgi:hypothetical protein